jgi:hypothetical protein
MNPSVSQSSLSVLQNDFDRFALSLVVTPDIRFFLVPFKFGLAWLLFMAAHRMYHIARGLSAIGGSYIGRALQVVGAALVRGTLIALWAVLEMLILWLNQPYGEPTPAYYLPFMILELTHASYS